MRYKHVLLAFAFAFTAAFAADYSLNSSSADGTLIEAWNTGSTNKTHLDIVSGTPGGTGVRVNMGDGTGYLNGIDLYLNASSGYGINSTLYVGNVEYGNGVSSYVEAGYESVAYGINSTVAVGNQGLAFGVYANAYDIGGASFVAAGYFNGDVWANAFPTISDRKFKQGIQDVSGGLDKIMALKPRTYTYKTEEFKGTMNLDKRSHIGFIAQELEEVLPELVLDGVNAVPLTPEEQKNGVKKDPVKFKGVDYTGVIPVLVKAVQEQQAEIASLRAEMASLKAAK